MTRGWGGEAGQAAADQGKELAWAHGGGEKAGQAGVDQGRELAWARGGGGEAGQAVAGDGRERAWAPLAAALLLMLAGGGAAAQDVLEKTARAYRENPGAAGRAALARIAAGSGRDAALANLALGVSGDPGGAEAVRALASARRGLPQLADAIAYFTAAAQARAKNHSAAAPALDPVWSAKPASPYRGRAALLGARALNALGDGKGALALLERGNGQAPEPGQLLERGKAQESLGAPAEAGRAYQEVYYGHPAAEEAVEAREGLARLRVKLGGAYPEAAPEVKLGRAQKLFERKQWAAARAEFVALAGSLGGAAGETARVRVAACDFRAGRTAVALRALEAASAQDREAKAERLHWVAQCYRRLERDDDLAGLMPTLELTAPRSPWRLQALQVAAGRFLALNDVERYRPLFQACAEFEASEETAACHWRFLWPAYLQRRAEAAGLLREHLNRFAAYEKAGAALYYLGRLAERGKDLAAARQLWRELLARFPNSYYGMLGGERLKRPELAQAGESAETGRWLEGLNWAKRPNGGLFATSPALQMRVERARLLARAGLDAWAEGELRYALKEEGASWAAVIELSELAQRRGAPDVALRYVKGQAPGYLFLPRAAAPERFWKLAFPWPYRGAITHWAKERGLDPALLAGLIRQESEFNVQAVSPVRAMGLTQVMPATGRELSRRIGLRGFRTGLLHTADTNLRLGTWYLKALLDSLDGSLEQALASYNGGKTRVLRWRKWGDFEEPAEFVETITIKETRDYVQIVLRNAQTYRELYAADPAPAYEAPPAAAAPAPKKQARKNVTTKRGKR
jgi:soluble lytic murein transglycosylase